MSRLEIEIYIHAKSPGKHSRKRTLYMWKLLATAYPVEFRQTSQYRSMKIEGPRLAMRDYLELVKSDSLKWQLVLNLATSFARVPELVGISKIRNLAALEVATPPHDETPEYDTETPVTALSDRIIRSWSELVHTSGAFAHLRVLKLCHQDLSGVVLRYLRTFPSLQVIVAYGCPGIHSMFMDGLEIDGWESRPGQEDKPPALYELYQTSFANMDGEPPALGQGGPILDFQIGQTIQESKRESTNAKTLYLHRTKAANRIPTENSALHKPTKRPREEVSASGERQRRSGPKRAVMRDRKAKDLGEILGNFL
ncbi:hypothetical protein BDV38DRAFT_278771 [Aspergillus pseudotamarii]|uniref:Uncharacterized protein n=1 Tax=Aspergillus pseudotamarii TaxID=132259 RepID=A0A5N6T6X2_ASPPS|nr:uncharacterized protein BDV38DRAFT_278771 [Aspergillus pseudotamarii]KAE8141986.1 hypothetical protein BDV38DRAFT_278771 [Aspergillus pseudotamarii]